MPCWVGWIFSSEDAKKCSRPIIETQRKEHGRPGRSWLQLQRNTHRGEVGACRACLMSRGLLADARGQFGDTLANNKSRGNETFQYV